MIAVSRSILRTTVVLVLTSLAYASGSGDPSAWKKDPSDWDVELYPVLVWAPFLGASVTLPQFPNLPNQPDLPGAGGGTRPTASASSSFNGAAFAGFRIEKNKWSASGNVLWAGLAADSTSPKAHIGLDIIYGQAMGGREILPNLFVEGGVRRMALNISAKVLDYPEVSRKPGFWDPLVGVTYRRPLGKKWRMDLHADGGGFGVGSDVDIAATAAFDWRFARHFGMTMGYGMLHFKNSNTVAQRTLTIDQTVHGPILGFGIYF